MHPERWAFARSVPPHPSPLPWGEGGPFAALGETVNAGFFSARLTFSFSPSRNDSVEQSAALAFGLRCRDVTQLDEPTIGHQTVTRSCAAKPFSLSLRERAGVRGKGAIEVHVWCY